MSNAKKRAGIPLESGVSNGVNEPSPSLEVLDAGEFDVWVEELQAAIRGDGEANVACGSCNACCSSSQFVQIGPEEIKTKARIPKALLFAAPRMPKGHVLLGYDAAGRCPMLVDGNCSIYQDRPQTCRTYDCRIFEATGLQIVEKDKVLIARQAKRWRFSYASDVARTRGNAMRAAAEFLSVQSKELPFPIVTTTQLAVCAFSVHELFYVVDASGIAVVVEPSFAEVVNKLESQT